LKKKGEKEPSSGGSRCSPGKKSDIGMRRRASQHGEKEREELKGIGKRGTKPITSA